MNLFKAYIERKKTKGYYKSYYYKNSFYSFDFCERYQALNKYETIFNTQTPVIFKGKAEFGINQMETGTALGKPRFIANHDNLNNYKIVHYKNSIQSLKNRSQLHYYSDRFFYGVQIFPYLSNNQKEELINLLKIKYGIPMSAELPIKIKDKEGNYIYISSNFSLSLEYFSGNPLMIGSVLDAFSRHEKRILSKKEKEKELIMDIL